MLLFYLQEKQGEGEVRRLDSFAIYPPKPEALTKRGHRWRFVHPLPHALSYCLYVPLSLILKPKEFCLVFASLAPAALGVGRSTPLLNQIKSLQMGNIVA
jgi:hypothetical protein